MQYEVQKRFKTPKLDKSNVLNRKVAPNELGQSINSDVSYLQQSVNNDKMRLQKAQIKIKQVTRPMSN